LILLSVHRAIPIAAIGPLKKAIKEALDNDKVEIEMGRMERDNPVVQNSGEGGKGNETGDEVGGREERVGEGGE